MVMASMALLSSCLLYVYSTVLCKSGNLLCRFFIGRGGGHRYGVPSALYASITEIHAHEKMNETFVIAWCEARAEHGNPEA
jgi:hypothetical protein